MVRDPFTHKNVKALYYASGFLRYWLPAFRGWKSFFKAYDRLSFPEREEVDRRVLYYHKKQNSFDLGPNAETIGEMKMPNRSKVYFIDLYEYLRFFRKNLSLHFLPGDIIEVPPVPTFVKSRPVGEGNENSILLNFNKVRHFTFVNDRVKFENKKDLLVCRNNLYQANRIAFFKKHFDNPLCDLGQVNTGTDHDEWVKPKMSISDHFQYKFILCLEGNDVASNLKWVMSSGSLAVMPKPKYETWFMEGTLIPDHHYVCVKDDYSDLNEKLNFYIENPEKAKEIVRNAQEYVRRFRNQKIEDICSVKVLHQYFTLSGQLSGSNKNG